MHIRRQLAPALVLAALSATALAAGDQPHWTYEGSEGPDRWSALSNDFAACSGWHQSPVNLAGTHSGDNGDITLNWKPFIPKVLNNGHTIQAAAAAGNTIKLGDKTYTLQQMHFHHPSEHTVDGKSFPLEAHFVNKDADGKLLVLGVLIDVGKANPEIAKLWEVAPKTVGDAQAKSVVDFSKLVPISSKFYRYSGSLTTPPCSEIVEWVVFADPITASKEQIDAFAKLYPANNRPVQALHDRTITFGR